MLHRSCDSEVSLNLSIASIAVLIAVSNPIVYSVHAISRSIVPGTPIVLIPCCASLLAPLKEPSPPITTIPSIPCLRQISAPFFWYSSCLNSRQRAVYKIVPPVWIISDTVRLFISKISSSKSPAKPRRIPFTFNPFEIPVRTTARIAAFIPGASPPLVKTPIVFTALLILSSFCALIYL